MNQQNRKSTYEDIIDLPHHRSRKHPPMKVADRAAQFAPFAALTGFEDAVKETARITERKHELTEDKIAEINECLMRLQENSFFSGARHHGFFVQCAPGALVAGDDVIQLFTHGELLSFLSDLILYTILSAIL